MGITRKRGIVSLEHELAELSLVYHDQLETIDTLQLVIAGQVEEIARLKQLVREYDIYLKHVVPANYAYSKAVLHLHQEAGELGIELGKVD